MVICDHFLVSNLCGLGQAFLQTFALPARQVQFILLWSETIWAGDAAFGFGQYYPFKIQVPKLGI